MLTFTLIVIALALIVLVVLSRKRTTAIQHIELAQHESLHPDIPASIVALARDGRQIDALREYRALTGCSLDVAKARIAAATASPKPAPSAYRIPGIN